MPQSKSAQKQARADVGRRLRNKSVQSQAKTDVTKAEKLIFSGELEAAQKAVGAAIFEERLGGWGRAKRAPSDIAIWGLATRKTRGSTPATLIVQSSSNST